MPFKHPSVTNSQYQSAHFWIKTRKVRPKECTNCGRSNCVIHWANVSGLYKKELDDFIALCSSCHKRFDCNGDPNRCARGHLVTGSNVYRYPDGATECRECRKINHMVSNPKSNAKLIKRKDKS